MKIFIEKVNIRNEYSDGTISEFGIIGKLKSGKEIEILDDEYLFDLRDYERKLVECLIYGEEGPEKEKYAVKGIFLRYYKIPPKLIEKTRLPPHFNELGFSRDDLLSDEERPAIKTQDRVILISPKAKLRNQTNTKYYISRYVLQAWYPIDE